MLQTLLKQVYVHYIMSHTQGFNKYLLTLNNNPYSFQFKQTTTKNSK